MKSEPFELQEINQTAMGLSVLFYVEPLIFRNQPWLLVTWLDWIADIIRANEDRATFAVVSSPFLCDQLSQKAGAALRSMTPVSQEQILGAFDFDRVAYLRDLFRPEGDPVVNHDLVARLAQAKEDFQPDVVLSFSQNRYLATVMAPARSLFLELGPLPRRLTPLSFFLDPRGHQTQSLLVTALARILSQALPADTEAALRALWLERIEQPTLAHPNAWALKQKLQAHKGDKRVALIALQPEDWLTYEGTYDALGQNDVVMRCLSQLPEGWVACVSYHPARRLPAEVEARILEEWPGTLFLPEEMGPGSSESALPFVDAVITISSGVGIQAVLWGKPLVALGQKSNLAALGASHVKDLPSLQGASSSERLRLFCFLTGFYLHRHDAVTRQPGYLVDWLLRWREEGDSDESFLSLQRWNASRAQSLLRPDEAAPAQAQLQATLDEALRAREEERQSHVREKAALQEALKASQMEREAQHVKLETQQGQLAAQHVQLEAQEEALKQALDALSVIKGSASFLVAEKLRRVPGLYALYLKARGRS